MKHFDCQDNGQCSVEYWAGHTELFVFNGKSNSVVLTDGGAKQLRDWLNAKYPVGAQGAQAGDLACAVRVLLEVPQLQGEQAFSAQPIIDRVRAALATQPAAIKLPPRQEYQRGHAFYFNNLCAISWNQCLDAVQKLNNVRGAEHE